MSGSWLRRRSHKENILRRFFSISRRTGRKTAVTKCKISYNPLKKRKSAMKNEREGAERLLKNVVISQEKE